MTNILIEFRRRDSALNQAARCTGNLPGLMPEIHSALPGRGKCLAPDNARRITWDKRAGAICVISFMHGGGLCLWCLPYLVLAHVGKIPKKLSLYCAPETPEAKVLLRFIQRVFKDATLYDVKAQRQININNELPHPLCLRPLPYEIGEDRAW